MTETDPAPPPAPEASTEQIVDIDDLDEKEMLRRIMGYHALLADNVTKLIENVVYVRDRFEARQTKLVERVKGLDARLGTIEEKLDIHPQVQSSGIAREDMEAIAEIVTNSVNSLGSIVDSLKKDLRQTMAESTQHQESDKLATIQASLAKVTSEFTSLRDLTLEFLQETGG